MKILLTILIALLNTTNMTDSIYSFNFKDIDGNETAFNKYEGKVLLVVNVASKCGYTPQYEGLQSIYEKYEEQGLVIVGFPANNFKGQEPGSNEDIKEFCQLEYGVDFPMASKVSVLGEDQDPIFSFLTSLPNQDFDGDIKWNFEKFLINKEGELIRRFRSSVKPESEDLTSAIEALL